MVRILLAVCLSFLLGGFVGCYRKEGTAEKAGKEIDRAADDVRDSIDDARDDLADKIDG